MIWSEMSPFHSAANLRTWTKKMAARVETNSAFWYAHWSGKKMITEVTAGHLVFHGLVRILKITCFLGEDDFGFPVSCWGNTGRLALWSTAKSCMIEFKACCSSAQRKRPNKRSINDHYIGRALLSHFTIRQTLF